MKGRGGEGRGGEGRGGEGRGGEGRGVKGRGVKGRGGGVECKEGLLPSVSGVREAKLCVYACVCVRAYVLHSTVP